MPKRKTEDLEKIDAVRRSKTLFVEVESECVYPCNTCQYDFVTNGHDWCFGAQLNSYSACYGNTASNYIEGACAEGEKIVMESVHAYAKPESSNCPTIMTSLNVSSSCCQYDSSDCGKKYEGESHEVYYENCDGKTVCIPTPVAWETTSNCTGTTYLERTNYMVAYFYCVSENEIQSISGNSSASDSAVFLWNTGYPSGNMTASSSYKCSVAASCATQLRVQALNLMFTLDGGVCGQSLRIQDDDTSTTFACESNTDHIPTLIYTSDSSYIEIEANNTFNTDSGYFFLLITGTDPSANLTLACGTSLGKGYISPDNLDSCTNSTQTTAVSTSAATSVDSVTSTTTTSPPTTTTTTTTTATSTTTDSVNATTDSVTTTANGKESSTNAQDSNSDGKSDEGSSTDDSEESNAHLWAIPIVIIIVLILAILLIVLYRDKLRACCCRDKKTESDAKSEISDSPLLTAVVATGPQVPPRTTFKSNAVAPDPENKLPPLMFIGAEAAHDKGESQPAENSTRRPHRLPPIAFFQAQQAFQEKAKKKKKLRKKEKVLERRESNIQAREAELEKSLEEIKAKERTLEKRLSGLHGQVNTTDTEGELQTTGNEVPVAATAQPTPLHRWSSILPSKVTFGTLANVVTAFQPKKSSSACIDVSNVDNGTLVSTHMNEETC